eukprot:14095358-Alexandrium_andersonii.AAC.2
MAVHQTHLSEVTGKFKSDAAPRGSSTMLLKAGRVEMGCALPLVRTCSSKAVNDSTWPFVLSTVVHALPTTPVHHGFGNSKGNRFRAVGRYARQASST